MIIPVARDGGWLLAAFAEGSPDDPDDAGDHHALRNTIAALNATGHRVNAELWAPTCPAASRCNSGGDGKCHQCHAGCYNSPK